MRVMHLLHRSVPGTHGYAIRSREIVVHQLAKGLEPIVVTSPSQAPLGELDSEGSEYIDGIRYFRTGSHFLPSTAEVYDPSVLRSALRVLQNTQLFTTALRVAKKYKPDVIHAHSPFTCGIISDLVGRIQGIPSFYEVRGIWEDSHTSRHGLSPKAVRYRAVRELENLALKGSDYTFVICEALKEEVISRGLPPERISIVPNGVDVETFVPGPAPSELRNRWGLSNKLVIGYIGSFFHYEGLDLLVRAMALISPQYPNCKLLLVGGGELSPMLNDLSQELGIQDQVIFTGKVPHKEITGYYKLCDIMVLPRRDTRETRLVTPLKPLEIMAMARPLIAADIGGHREIVVEGTNGLLFKAEDVSDLALSCSKLLDNPEYRSELGLRGRDWVIENRDWSVLITKYVDAYELLKKEHFS